MFAQRASTGVHPVQPRVAQVLGDEDAAGMRSAEFYGGFQARAEQVKNDFLAYLIEAKRRGTRLAAYGAAAKGNTLLNFAGVKPDLLPFVADAAPSKQDRFLPGSRIPVVSPAALAEWAPDEVLILPWNIAREIAAQHASLRQRGTRFVTVIPEIKTW